MTTPNARALGSKEAEELTIEPLRPEHWDSVAGIYGEGIASRNATFHSTVPRWESWDSSHLREGRLVALNGGDVVGWAALSPISDRCVYGGVAEDSVYVAGGARCRGIGHALLAALIERSEEQGIWTIQCGIFPENEVSVRLHARCGFRVVGRRERLGQNNGVWRDVLLLERRSRTVGSNGRAAAAAGRRGAAGGGRGHEGSVLLMATPAEELREQVRQRYAESARGVMDGAEGCGSGKCCADGEGEPGDFGEALYDVEQRGELPDAALLASLGCGNPTAVAQLVEGETVLDLGSGGGIDVILSARRVGPTGTAYGLDMSDEMLALARKNAQDAGAANVHFLKGLIEQIPLPAESVDVVISNCVVNLSTDKPAVLTEISRVLRPGGRVGISDVVTEDHLAPNERATRGSHVGCIAGALSKSEYRAGLEAAGFEQISVHYTHQVVDGMHGAIIKAVKTSEDPPNRLSDTAAMDSPDAAHFDRRAEAYDVGRIGIWHRRVGERVGAIALAAVPRPAAVLDVGCGTGHLLADLARNLPETERLIGVDPALGMVERARLLTVADSRLAFEQASAERLPFESGLFDLVMSALSFDHWSDQRAGLAECARVLHPSGRLVLADLVAWWFWPAAVLGGSRARTAARLEALLRDVGLVRVRWEPVFGLGPLPLVQAAGAKPASRFQTAARCV